MFNKIRNLFKSSIGYTFGNMLSRALFIISMPILTRYLAPSEYGIISIVNAVAASLMTFYGFGAQDFIMRYYYEQKSEVETKKFLGGIFLYFLIITFSLSALLSVVGKYPFELFFSSIPFSPYMIIGVWIAFIAEIEMVPDALFRLRNEVRLFVVIKITRVVLQISLAILFVVFLRRGAEGPLLATLIVAALVGAYYLYYLRDKIQLNLSLTLIRQCYRFTTPVVILLFGRVLLESIDKFFLQRYTDLSVVGYYSVGTTVGSVLVMLAYSIDMAWAPFYYSTATKESEPHAKEIISYSTTYFVTIIVFVALIPVILRYEIISLLAPAGYYPVIAVVPVIMIASLLHALFPIPLRGFYFRKKTHYLPVIILFGLAVSILLNIVLIQRYQLMGAALANVGTAAVMLTTSYVLSQKVYRIPYQYFRMLKAAAAAVICALLSNMIPTVREPGAVALKIALIASFPAQLYLLQYFEDRELERAKQMLRTVLGQFKVLWS